MSTTWLQVSLCSFQNQLSKCLIGCCVQSCDARLKLSDIQPVFGATILKVVNTNSANVCICKDTLSIVRFSALHSAANKY